MKIGVFDSGVGGLSVANAVRAALPEHEIILREDREHVPYGTRPPSEILTYVVPIFELMVREGCGVIVVACNTVTTTLINELRRRFSVPLIAIEPMVKPAVTMTKTGVVAVCATPITLASSRYRQLKDQYAQDIQVLEPDCSDWPAMIEHNKVDKAKVQERISKALDAGADVIVLGCTHYHWIENEINEIAEGKALVIQPESAIVAELTRVLERLD